MNRINAFFLGQRDNAVDIQIRGDRTFALADEVSFVGLEAMETKAILLGIDGHGAEPEFGARAENADRDFAAVGSEEFFERTDAGAGGTGFASIHCGHATVFIVGRRANGNQ